MQALVFERNGQAAAGTGVFEEPAEACPVHRPIRQLLAYCRNNDWAGFDPYDALNSRLFAALPVARSTLCRLAFTQALKRCPVNMRPLLLIPPEHNPKALALFISALLRLRGGPLQAEDGVVQSLLSRLAQLRSPGQAEYCWGYHFDWQGRRLLAPRYSPNIVCTTFAANALLDAYDAFGSAECLQMALSAGWFILAGLNISWFDDSLCFSYTPADWGKVHNANLLAAALLARLYGVSGEKRFLEYAQQAARYSVSRQNPDGSWFYGEDGAQKWIDNFHTGFNLVALRGYGRYAGTSIHEEAVRRGYDFYRAHFFTSRAVPKYFHNRTHPIDSHCIAQSFVTLAEMSDVDEGAPQLMRAVLAWACANMQSQEGYFFYQQGRFIKNRIPYMRWTQAWMLYGLATAAPVIGGAGSLENGRFT